MTLGAERAAVPGAERAAVPGAGRQQPACGPDHLPVCRADRDAEAAVGAEHRSALRLAGEAPFPRAAHRRPDRPTEGSPGRRLAAMLLVPVGHVAHLVCLLLAPTAFPGQAFPQVAGPAHAVVAGTGEAPLLAIVDEAAGEAGVAAMALPERRASCRIAGERLSIQRDASRSPSVGSGWREALAPRLRVRSVDRVARLDRVGTGVAMTVVRHAAERSAAARAGVVHAVRLKKPSLADVSVLVVLEELDFVVVLELVINGDEPSPSWWSGRRSFAPRSAIGRSRPGLPTGNAPAFPEEAERGGRLPDPRPGGRGSTRAEAPCGAARSQRRGHGGCRSRRRQSPLVG